MSTPAPAVIETAALDAQGADIVAQARAIVIADDATFQGAVEFAKLTRAYIAKVEEEIGPLVTAAHASWKLAVAKRDALTAHAVSAKTIVDQRMAAYNAEVIRQRREAAEAQTRAREQAERAERARVAAERLRLQREAEERQLAAAMAKEQAGDVQAMEQILSAPPVVEPVAPRPVFIPPVAATTPALPKAAGVSFRTEWDFEVLDASLIPREYMTVDWVAIRRVCRALKGQTQISGIRAIEKPVTAIRR